MQSTGKMQTYWVHVDRKSKRRFSSRKRIAASRRDTTEDGSVWSMIVSSKHFTIDEVIEDDSSHQYTHTTDPNLVKENTESIITESITSTALIIDEEEDEEDNCCKNTIDSAIGNGPNGTIEEHALPKCQT
jgi:hypothetical protein